MTTPSEPHFELRRVLDDGTESEPVVVSLAAAVDGLATSRRGFLGSSISVAALLGSLDEAAAATGSSLPKRLLRAHRDDITDLAIGGDGRRLATASGDGTYKIWSLDDKKLLSTSQKFPPAVTTVTFAGAIPAAALPGGAIQLGDPGNRAELRKLSGQGVALLDLAATPDGSLLIAAGSDGWLNFWSLPGGEIVEQVHQHKSGARTLALTASGDRLASGADDGSIKVWKLPERTIAFTLSGHAGAVTRLMITPDGSRLISRGVDHTLKVWNLTNGSLLRTLTEPWNRAEHLALDPAGALLATSTGNSISLWTVPGGKTLGTLKGHRAPIEALEISPNGELLVSGDRLGVVIVWDLKEKRLISYLYDPDETGADTKGVTYTVKDATSGYSITYTLPCGSPIPPGAVCICNCVPGKISIPTVVPKPTYIPRTTREPTGVTPYYIPRFGTGCSCNLVCTCNTIPFCHARRLLHGSPAVRLLAEQLLLTMGPSALEYLRWVLSSSDGKLRQCVARIVRQIQRRRRPHAGRWPAATACRDLLDCSDEVIATMAAQALQVRYADLCVRMTDDERLHAETLVCDAIRRPWYVRYEVSDNWAFSVARCRAACFDA